MTTEGDKTDEQSATVTVEVHRPGDEQEAKPEEGDDIEERLGKYFISEEKRDELMGFMMRNDDVQDGKWRHYTARAQYIRTYNEFRCGRYEGETKDQQTYQMENAGVPRDIIDIVREDLAARKFIQSAKKRYDEAGEECPVPSFTQGNIPEEPPKRQKKKKKQ